jgi:hypothetical protein
MSLQQRTKPTKLVYVLLYYVIFFLLIGDYGINRVEITTTIGTGYEVEKKINIHIFSIYLVICLIRLNLYVFIYTYLLICIFLINKCD